MSSNPPHVLFVESGTEMGGAQIALLNLLENLRANCIRPFFVSLGFGSGDLPDRVEHLGVPVFQLPGGRYRNVAASARKCARLVKLIREQRIDLVFSNGGHSNLLARPAARMAGVPSVWWSHGYDSADVLRGRPIAFAQMWAGADVILANSEFTARHLSRHFSGARMRVISPGVDCRRFRPATEEGRACRAALQIAGDEFVAGIFGRLQPWKGQHVFLGAAAIVLRGARRCRFLVVGGTPYGLSRDYPGQLAQLAGELGISDRVHFLGQREDVNGLMNACDVVVHASTEPEPWGQVVAEAMAAGRAVIAAAAGGPPEMIRCGEDGLLAVPGDARGLAAALETLRVSPSMRQCLGRAARDRATAKFDAHTVAARVCRELRAAMGTADA